MSAPQETPNPEIAVAATVDRSRLLGAIAAMSGQDYLEFLKLLNENNVLDTQVEEQQHVIQIYAGTADYASWDEDCYTPYITAILATVLGPAKWQEIMSQINGV